MAADLSSGTDRDTVKQRHERGIYDRAGYIRATGRLENAKQHALSQLRGLHDQAPDHVLAASPDVSKKRTAAQVRSRMKDFASTDASRPQLNGYFYSKGTATATDGHRLAMVPAPEEGHRSGEIHTVTGDPNKRVDTYFPDYTEVIPKHEQMVDHLDATHLQKVLGHYIDARAGGDERGPQGFSLTRRGGDVFIENTEAARADGGKPRVSVKVGRTQHPDGSIGLNAVYLHDAVRGLQAGQTAALHWNTDRDGKLSPMQVKRPDGEHHVIMPMRL